MVLSEAGKPDIGAVLAEASAAKLKELAKNYYVKGYSKMNKPALVQAVSAALREPGRMEELLYIIDQPAFLLFKRAAKSREPVKVKKALPEQCGLLEDLGYLVCDASQEDLIVTVPTEISEVFHQLEREGYTERKARYDLLDSYAMAAVHLYGAISQPDLVDIFNRQNSQPTTEEELFPALLRHVAVDAPYCFWEEYIVCGEFEENDFEDVRDLMRQCGGKPRYIPEKDELLRYADWNYYERTPQMDALTAFLMDEGHQPRRDAEEIAREIQYACVVEAGMEQIYDILSDYDMELDGSAVGAFAKVMMSVKNNTRLWANKGHRAHSRQRRLFVRGQHRLQPPSGQNVQRKEDQSAEQAQCNRRFVALGHHRGGGGSGGHHGHSRFRQQEEQTDPVHPLYQKPDEAGDSKAEQRAAAAGEQEAHGVDARQQRRGQPPPDTGGILQQIQRREQRQREETGCYVGIVIQAVDAGGKILRQSAGVIRTQHVHQSVERPEQHLTAAHVQRNQSDDGGNGRAAPQQAGNVFPLKSGQQNDRQGEGGKKFVEFRHAAGAEGGIDRRRAVDDGETQQTQYRHGQPLLKTRQRLFTK